MRIPQIRCFAIVVLGLLAASCSKEVQTPVTPQSSAPIHDPAACNYLIGDYVWNDLDADGCQDAGEPAIEGVTLILRDATGSELATTRTDANGWYRFAGLCPGTYQVEAMCPDDCESTMAGACASDRDSSPNPATVTLTDCDETIDFGFVCDMDDPKDPEDCGECKGKVTELTLRYTGASAARVMITQKEGTVFDGTVLPGGMVSILGRDDKGTLGKEIELMVDGRENARIHTSCSQPIGPGLVAGDFEVVAGRSLEGGPLCPCPPAH